MSWGVRREFGRKLIHLFSLSFILVYLTFNTLFTHRMALLMLSFMLIILLEIEYIRIELKPRIPILSDLWKRYRRTHEKKALGGEVFFLIGAIITLAIFDVRVAVAGILMTTFGDTAAALFGKLGKIQLIKGRNLEGIIAEFFVNFIICFFVLRDDAGKEVLNYLMLQGDPIWTTIFVMSTSATFIETIVTKLDDNLLVPLFSGFLGHLTLLLRNFNII